MIESVAIMNLFNSSHEYLLKVYTKKAIGRLLRKEFHQEWEKKFLLRKRQVEVEHKEIRIFLRKGDTIQKYIDCVPEVLNTAAGNLKLIQKKRNEKKRHMILKKDYPAKAYLRQKSHFAAIVDRATAP